MALFNSFFELKMGCNLPKLCDVRFQMLMKRKITLSRDCDIKAREIEVKDAKVKKYKSKLKEIEA
jgi:hypothetical protein